MAITFTNDRYFRTDVGSKIFQNVPHGEPVVQDSGRVGNPLSAIPSQTRFLSKVIFDFWHMFMPGARDDDRDGAVHLHELGGHVRPGRSAAHDRRRLRDRDHVGWRRRVTEGLDQRRAHAVRHIHRKYPEQLVGAPDRRGIANSPTSSSRSTTTTSGITTCSRRAISPTCSTAPIPPRSAQTATWRGRWTLAGTTGANAAIGDAGLKNAFGGGGSLGIGWRRVGLHHRWRCWLGRLRTALGVDSHGRARPCLHRHMRQGCGRVLQSLVNGITGHAQPDPDDSDNQPERRQPRVAGHAVVHRLPSVRVVPVAVGRADRPVRHW